MNIIIEKGSLVECAQVQFNKRYPFLELKFFKKHSTGRSFLTSEYPSEEYLEDIPGFVGSAVINISSDRTVKELEQEFKDQVGLTAQIFRRAGNVWIETTVTNNWTLEKQNNEGEQISKHFQNRWHQ